MCGPSGGQWAGGWHQPVPYLLILMLLPSRTWPGGFNVLATREAGRLGFLLARGRVRKPASVRRTRTWGYCDL